MPSVQLEAGTIHYEEAGPPSGRPVVFVHGYLMGGDLWADLASRLAAQGLRCVMPTWPLGSHPEPMAPGADLSPRGVVRIVAAFLDALELEDVVLVGNDSGGALCQAVAVDHPERLGALVLTNCDVLENMPPSFFKLLPPIARVPRALRAVLAPMRWAPLRRSPLGYGLLSHGDVDHLARGWVRPLWEVDGIFEDIRRFTVAISNELTLDAGPRLAGFDRPVLIAWGADDRRLFPLRDAARLAALLPDARLEPIVDARTYVMLDQPDRLAALIGELAGVPAVAA